MMRRTYLGLAALSVAIGLLALGAFRLVELASESPGEPPGPPRAAIVDQLSLTFPNPAFVEEATSTLERAGYVVDYYPGEQVTVDFYQQLPTLDYHLLIVRAHSGLVVGPENEPEDAFLFTTERYSQTKYAEEQRERRLALAHAFQYAGDDIDEMMEAFRDEPRYFGVGSGFVRSSMKGKFDDTKVVLMGCNVLASEKLAEAFVDRGADTVVGWDEFVSASHTDAATQRLLRYLLSDGLSMDDAVAQTMEEVGPDPAYGSKLLVYPD